MYDSTKPSTMTTKECDLMLARWWRRRAALLSLKSSIARRLLREAAKLEAKWNVSEATNA